LIGKPQGAGDNFEMKYRMDGTGIGQQLQEERRAESYNRKLLPFSIRTFIEATYKHGSFDGLNI
jgi:hypothetical protein